MIQNILSATTVREKLSSLIKKEELEILAQNPNFLQNRQQAHNDLKNGKTISLADLNEELGL